MRSPTLLAIALATHFALPLMAEEPAPVAPSATTVAIAPELLAERLPKVPSVVVRDGRLWWDAGAAGAVAFAPVDVGDGNPLLETEIGPLEVDRSLVAANRTDPVAEIPRLVAAAKAAGLTSSGLLLREGALAGIHLRGADAVVVLDGVLRKVEPPAMDRQAEVASLAQAVSTALAALPSSKLDDLGRSSVEGVLHLVAVADGRRDLDELAPSMARRLIRSGWMETFLPGNPAAVALAKAVEVAERLQPVTLYEGAGLRLAEVKDAFGRGGWVLTTPNRSAFLRPHPEPQYHSNVARMSIAVDLPPGSDPLVPGLRPLSVRLWRGNAKIASWTSDAALDVDEAVWREAVPGKGRRGVDPNAVTGFLPPHLAVAALNGDMVGLVTRSGFLAAPLAGQPKDHERFLREAAAQLRDPALLDLLGEYFVTYVYDSPDSRFPGLVGSKQVKGDIHQTAEQTVATVTGGICRGDCDDVAELYQNITERQGRIAIVLSLPSHAALAWAEKKEDAKWHVFVLQTGPALEFIDEDLPKALEQAYKSFDESDAFDPNGLGLLLRFSGENTRSSWRLSWRIFAERNYARTMIDVQRDWHFQTYQRGINTMQELIKGGDLDTANYRELSGLYSFTGQYDLAAEYHRKALDATPQPESRLYMKSELIEHLLDGNHVEDAKGAVEEVLTKDLPTLKPKLGPSVWQAGLQLAATLGGHHQGALALRIMEDTLLEAPSDKVPSLAAQIDKVAAYLQSPKFNQSVWDGSSQFLQLRHLTSSFAGLTVSVLADLGPGGLAEHPQLAESVGLTQRWLDEIAFHDADDPGDYAGRYAVAGRFYAALLGEAAFMRLLDAAPLPAAERNHQQRTGGMAQMHLDLPWIRASVPFWWSRLAERFGRERTSLDAAGVAADAAHLQEAYECVRRLGQEDVQLDHQHHLGLLVAALVARDEQALRKRLRFVKEKDDKRLRDDTAQWLGDVARFLPMDWYAQVIGIWQEEVDYKPKWYWIAWRAALNGGTQHALLVAAKAAQRYSDDPAFVEEYQFMRRLYEGK